VFTDLIFLIFIEAIIFAMHLMLFQPFPSQELPQTMQMDDHMVPLPQKVLNQSGNGEALN
jgi:hypothetical protein